ncbi:hypothetical protein FRB90_008902 [Tulasnella sp. 427]|nr:hypothetical protein FRB90_008902 [Tulasnella sp. 427]
MPAARTSPAVSNAGQSSPNKRMSSQSSPVTKQFPTDVTSEWQSLQLFSLSDALEDLLKKNVPRKTSDATPLLPAVPTSSWVIDLTEANEPSLTPIQPWPKNSIPQFDDRLHRKWSGEWEPLPSSQAADPAAGILKSSLPPPSRPASGRRTSLGVDGYSAITKINTETNHGDGPLALSVRLNDNVGWDAATEVDSENGSVAGDDEAADPEEIAVESVLGIKRSTREWDGDMILLPSAKRPRISAFPKSPGDPSGESSQAAGRSSQMTNLETQSSTQVDGSRVSFGPDPDGHPHKTKAKSMSTQHRKKQAERRRKAARGQTSSSSADPSLSPQREDTRMTKEALKAKEEQHFTIRDRVYERVGILLDLYEDRVLLNSGLDLREVRMRYTLQPWNPNRRRRDIERVDGVSMALNGPEQWKLCTPAIGDYIRIAYPPEDHPAWSVVDGGSVQRWKQSEEYLLRRTAECQIGYHPVEIATFRSESIQVTEQASWMETPAIATKAPPPRRERVVKKVSRHTGTARQPRLLDLPSSLDQLPRRSTRNAAVVSSPPRPTRSTRSSSVENVLPSLVRCHSNDSLSSRPSRNTRSHTRARSSVTPTPLTHTRRLRSTTTSS